MGGQEKIVIAGAGQAALSCAKALRLQGFKGEITLIGDESYPPYDRPPLSKNVLVGKAQVESTFYLSLSELAEQGIEFRAEDKVVAIDRDRKAVFSLRGKLEYDHLVLALGARVRRLALPGSDSKKVLYLRSIDDCLTLRKQLTSGLRVIVLGGGLIGLEVAAAATALGAEVVVIEAADRVMARIVDAKVSHHFERLHRAHGVRIIAGKKPIRISDQNGTKAFVELEDGDCIEGDLIVAGIGVVPNDDVAAAAGLQTGNGVWTDEFCCTDDPAIWAIGDVANQFNPLLGQRLRLETWQNARTQGATVARNICGSRVAHTELPWGWSDQFGANLQMLGLSDPADLGVVRGCIETGTFSIFYLRNGALAGMVAVNAVPDVVVSRRLMARKSSVDPDKLGDLSVPLKSLI
ncbi:MAG: NAD(P)/FAD-dependent oxidoreductase [Parvibaculaceae bacterium]